MKKNTILFMALAMTATCVSARTLKVETGSVSYHFPAAETGEMPFTAASELTIMGKTFSLADVSAMSVTDSDEMPANTVEVIYAESGAAVKVAGGIASQITVTVSGAHVSIAQTETVAEEITYSLSGAATNGSLTLAGSYKSTIELNGLTLTNPSGAALSIVNGKRINLILADGSANSLTDGADGSQKGCIHCKGHLEIKGQGSLSLTGRTAHALYAKEYVEIKSGTVNVLSAVKDGINCNQYFLMKGGELNVSSTGDDAVQVSIKDATAADADDTGSLTVRGGKITATVTARAAKCLKAEGAVSIEGGELTLTATGGGQWDSEKSKTKASACISADGPMEIIDGTLSLTAKGSGGKGLSGNSTLSISGGVTEVSTSGGMFVYTNGSASDNYTGNTDRLSSSAKSSPKGMKFDGAVTISAGSVKVTTTGNGGEGIESKSTLTVSGGTVRVTAYDDGLNSASHMYLQGGEITSVSTSNDGIDSNGDMNISGGRIIACGARSPECGLDANEEEGYSVHLTGGTVLALGGGNSVPSGSSGQPYVSSSLTATAGAVITIKSGSELLASFTVPSDYSPSSSQGGGRFEPGRMMPPPPPPAGAPRFAPGGWGGGGGGPMGGGAGLIISCPSLTSGSSYTVTVGSSSATVTAEDSKTKCKILM